MSTSLAIAAASAVIILPVIALWAVTRTLPTPHHRPPFAPTRRRIRSTMMYLTITADTSRFQEAMMRVGRSAASLGTTFAGLKSAWEAAAERERVAALRSEDARRGVVFDEVAPFGLAEFEVAQKRLTDPEVMP